MPRVTVSSRKECELLHGRGLAFRANVAQSTFDRRAFNLFDGKALCQHVVYLGFHRIPIELGSQRGRTVDKHRVLNFRSFGFDELMKLVIVVIG